MEDLDELQLTGDKHGWWWNFKKSKNSKNWQSEIVPHIKKS
jgi:hypothetical protein